ncbi:hypothetical protein M378DRAFT_171672 [Amanita muscaria Koide BX008]|uniref:Uncharacterized protein n=1 Tax=Amanita muscaria (strain Koide BX008) TaxID=946122 RepID=A0A0C2SU41_AMAMK|nr:hypothetical protein M378DRAFT_171672 [Amanita muscaria Koide BX008]
MTGYPLINRLALSDYNNEEVDYQRNDIFRYAAISEDIIYGSGWLGRMAQNGTRGSNNGT